MPTGSSRSPKIECDRPSAESAMNRFDSAIPSSRCWPAGEKVQLKVDGIRSFLNVSAISSLANRPRRFTQAPRLVETVTSGEVVTMRLASSVSPLAISCMRSPNPACVESEAAFGTGRLSGTGMVGAS